MERDAVTDDVMVYVLALAFYDGAFEDFSSPQELFDWLDSFPRDADRCVSINYNSSKLRESPFKNPFSRLGRYEYETFLARLKDLSKCAGYELPITPYDIRRGTANTINGRYYLQYLVLG